MAGRPRKSAEYVRFGRFLVWVTSRRKPKGGQIARRRRRTAESRGNGLDQPSLEGPSDLPWGWNGNGSAESAKSLQFRRHYQQKENENAQSAGNHEDLARHDLDDGL